MYVRSTQQSLDAPYLSGDLFLIQFYFCNWCKLPLGNNDQPYWLLNLLAIVVLCMWLKCDKMLAPISVALWLIKEWANRGISGFNRSKRQKCITRWFLFICLNRDTQSWFLRKLALRPLHCRNKGQRDALELKDGFHAKIWVTSNLVFLLFMPLWIWFHTHRIYHVTWSMPQFVSSVSS